MKNCLDPKNPVPYVQELIDRVNRGEMLNEWEVHRLWGMSLVFQEVDELIDPVGREILSSQFNDLFN